MPSRIPSTQTTLSAKPPHRLRWLVAAISASTLLAACSPEAPVDRVGAQEEVLAAPMQDRAARQVAQNEKVAELGKMRKEASGASAMFAVAGARASAPAPRAAADSASVTAKPSAPGQRFLAVSHNMQIESPAAELAGQWEAVKSACERLDCYVEASGLQRETSHAAAGAFLTMRVNPRDFAMLSGTLGGNAKVLNHQTSTEDKTSEVVDVEAQLKNRSEYRDSLRELLREKNVKRTLSELMEIRDTMSQVQAEIDAANTRRALLERETAKQLVQMQFQPARVIASGTYSPWRQTWQRSWDNVTHSMQSMVLSGAALLPWLIVLGVILGLPLWLGARKWLRSQKEKAQAAEVDKTQSK